jgi:hypothetical protein
MGGLTGVEGLTRRFALGLFNLVDRPFFFSSLSLFTLKAHHPSPGLIPPPFLPFISSILFFFPHNTPSVTLRKLKKNLYLFSFSPSLLSRPLASVV